MRDLTGLTFNKLTVIKQTSNGKHPKWLCLCECGKYKEVRTDHLISGASKSCGCNHSISPLVRKHNLPFSKGHEPLYRVWRTMKARCKKDPAYKDVIICQEWYDFEMFYKWAIANGYKKGLTIDRKNPFGNYEPNNCHWITIQKQQRNRKQHVIITVDQVSKKAWEWESETGIPAKLIRSRIRRGWDSKRAVSEPTHK
jgi:hypothetical protein